MIGLIVLFIVLAIVAGIIGFGAAATAGMIVVKVLFWIFIALLIISLISWLMSGFRRGPVV
jgi:uncharacterized membrane protein YtjA (UPF0391 family)